MALKKTIKLKRFQVLDAVRTAPKDMGVLRLLARVAGTFGDSLYGKASFDVVVVGDDPLVSLCLAASLKRSGKSVLLAPDSLGTQDWPSKDWGYRLAQLVNYFDESVASVLSQYLHDFESQDGYMKALSALISEVARHEQVMILAGDCLQSSKGMIKGCDELIFFPVRGEFQHTPLTNPLWRIVRESLVCLAFQHSEIEFIQARRLLITTPTSRFIDPAIGTRIGVARETQMARHRYSRADNVLSSFSLILREQ